jgi:hypothetical protein
MVLGQVPPHAELLPALGTWALRRQVLDRVSGRRGRVRGVMEISLELGANGGGQRWSESGVLRWDGQDHPVTRVLLLRPGAQGAWWVHFADGRPFHPWRLGEVVEHPCAADVYRGRIDVGPRWMTVRWEVSGPCKDQLVASTYDLLDAAPTPQQP